MNLLSNYIKNRLPLFGVIYLSWLLFPVELQSDVDHECLSLDIRNECQNFAKLRNCSVITGYLIIVLLPLQNSGESCDLEHYRFPLLREITDFLIFYEVRNMTSLRKMFPNLTVIRGQQLFLNYALGITYMNDLQTLEFGSLIAIQRGHIIIGNNPKLCHLDRINWDRLTLTAGENHIFPIASKECPSTLHTECPDNCKSEYCWSGEVCQYFENDHPVEGQTKTISSCPENCLGGCLPNSYTKCKACRTWTDHGKCVDKCPKGLYSFEHYLRCYTRSECLERGGVIHQDQCLETCPSGYKLNKDFNECKMCLSGESCRKICTPLDATQPFWVYSLGDVDALKGCQILNGSVFISLRNRIDESDLMRGFADVQEIQGHLKIYKSHHLSSLKFLRNLRKIHGRPLENEHYALVLYNNRRVQELWKIEGHLEFEHGGMYIHLNNRLCNRYLKQFIANVVHDRSLNSLQSSEEEVLCDPSKLSLQLKVLSHDSIELFWPIVQTSDNVVIIYRASLKSDNVDSKSQEQEQWDSDLNRNVCERNIWQRVPKSTVDLEHNLTHYRFVITNLEAYTYYTVLIKTFSQDNDYNSDENIRSELVQIRTKMDLPRMPFIKLKGKTENSLTISIDSSFDSADGETKSVIDYFILELFDMFAQEMKTITRNYCREPAKRYPLEVSFENCCHKAYLQQETEHFDDLMRQTFSCDAKHSEYCESNQAKEKNATVSSFSSSPTFVKRLEFSETVYTLKYLERYRLYRIEVRACNRVGCSSSGIITARTNYSLVADRLHDLSVCQRTNLNSSGHFEYHVYFTDPHHPNGLITSYIIHFRNSSMNSSAYVSKCILFEEHSRLKYPQPYIMTLSDSFEQISVQVHSLAGYTSTDWKSMSHPCEIQADIFDKETTASSHQSRGMTIFVTFFLLSALVTALWICYKRRYWQKMSLIRRHLPVPLFFARREMLPQAFRVRTSDDRQILVDSFDSVHYQHTPDHEILKFPKLTKT